MPDRKLLFTRTLPGGGVVTIEAESKDSACQLLRCWATRTLFVAIG